jgi:hypothetical protein
MSKSKKPVLPADPPLNPLRTRWTATAREWLLGRTIVNVRYLTDEEVNELGIYASGVRLYLDDGTECDVMSDDEGNGPGALHVFNPHKGQETICVVS